MDKLTTNIPSLTKNLSSKVEVIESNLHQTLYNFRDFVAEFEHMHMEIQSIKKQITAQKEKCESKCCDGSEELKKVIESKDNIICLVASALTKLNETKNFNILCEIYKVLFGESMSLNNLGVGIKKEVNSDDINIDAMTLISPKEEPPENLSVEEEDGSVSEIDGTPTGRHSPIIQSKKLKSSTPNNTIFRDKIKCPENWATPDKKTIKLTVPTPTRRKGSGKLRQQRITVLREKPTNIVDLTTSPQFSKGRGSQTEECKLNNIKQEVIENDDTIMPSPTSGPIFPPIFKCSPKKSPQKFKRPLSLLRSRAEKTTTIDGKENRVDDVTKMAEPESVDLLKEFHNGFKSPMKHEFQNNSPTKANDSISLLQQLNTKDIRQAPPSCMSPLHRPLVENLNAVNTPPCYNESMSILPADVKVKTGLIADTRSKCQIVEPLYKEPTVRKKAEKRALPGWSCERCEKFYGELYKDNPEILEKKMDECSKHRGKNNPARPKTPPGYWEPRWDVPDDTEEFNRRNNAI